MSSVKQRNQQLANFAKAKKWQKGVSGNPNGRPRKEMAIAGMLREIGDRPVDPYTLATLHRKYGPDHSPKTMREALLMAAYKDAAAGDDRAREFIADRTEGRVPQAMVNLNANQNTDDLTKMPLAKLLELARDLKDE